MLIYFPSGKYKLSIRSFLEYRHIIFDVQYFMCALKRMFVSDDGNMQKYFSVLNFTIICIKPFTCNKLVSFLNEILFLHVFLNTVIIDQHLKNLIPRTLTSWLYKHSWVIFFPKCIHLLQLCGENFNFMLLYIYYIYTIIYTIVYRLYSIIRIWLLIQGCLIYKILPFWFFNPFEYLPVLFSSRLLLWVALLAFTFPAASYLLALAVWGTVACFCIFKSSVLVACKNYVF